MKVATFFLTFSLLFYVLPTLGRSEQLYFDLESPTAHEEGVTVNFTDVHIVDFLRYVSEIAQVNFIYNKKFLDFKISLFTGKATTPHRVLSMALELLRQQGIIAKCDQDNYYLLREDDEKNALSLPPSAAKEVVPTPITKKNYKGTFHTHPLHYHSGEEIRTAIQQMITGMQDAEKFFPDLLISVGSMQWLKSTNSLIYSGTEKGIKQLSDLIDKLDTDMHKKEQKRSTYLAAAENSPFFSSLTKENSPFSSLYPEELPKKNDFKIYKLQYHVGDQISATLQKMTHGLQHTDQLSLDLLNSVKSMQWVEATNSLIYSGTDKGIDELTHLIQALDHPKKQVFIEVLVIETNLKNSLEFGLQWGSSGQYRNKFRYGTGNFLNPSKEGSFADALMHPTSKNSDGKWTPGKSVPLSKGFNLGMIGDILLHKGKSYFSLGSLVSALQEDDDNTIILNEKVIAQDNETSTVFTGENIPFVGSTIAFEEGSVGKQTTSNIEYRDVGFKLDITPLIGEGDVITLKIAQEISEAKPDPFVDQGIRTSKTDMDAQAHVPDRNFVVLSGMMRKTKKKDKSGLPCLGGLPIIGAAFSKTTKNDDKRNIMIFVYPQIIHSNEEYRDISCRQEEKIKSQTGNPQTIQAAIDWLTKETMQHETNSTPSKPNESDPTPSGEELKPSQAVSEG